MISRPQVATNHPRQSGSAGGYCGSSLLAGVAFWIRYGPLLPVWGWTPEGDCRCPAGSACKNHSGKHPVGALVRHGVNGASRDPEVLQRWCNDHRTGGIALATGHGVWGLDEDEAGSLAAFELPETLEARTRNGGRHLIWLGDAPVGNKVRPLAGIDVRALGGYLVVWPTPGYTVTRDRDPVEAPENLLLALEGATSQPAGARHGPTRSEGKVPPPESFSDAVDELARMPKGRPPGRLRACMSVLGCWLPRRNKVLTWASIRRRVLAAMHTNGAVETYGESEVLRAMESAEERVLDRTAGRPDEDTESLERLIEAGQATAVIAKGEDLSERWALQNLLEVGQTGILFGEPKAGKSLISLWIIARSLKGQDPFPWKLGRGWRPRKVLFLSEMPLRLAKRYFRACFDPTDFLAERVVFVTANFKRLIANHLPLADAVGTLVERVEGVDLLVFDTLTFWSLLGGGDSLNDAGPVARFIAAAADAAARVDATSLIVAHARKDSLAEGKLDFNALLGSVAGRGGSDANIALRIANEEAAVVEILTEGRDVGHIRELAGRADRLGRDPEAAAGDVRVSPRHWFVRLSWNALNNTVEYVKAEDHLLARSASEARVPDPDRLQEAALAALRTLHGQEQTAAERDGRAPIHVFAKKAIGALVRDRWVPDGYGTDKNRPGRGRVDEALVVLQGAGAVLYVEKHPGNKRRGGYLLPAYRPEGGGEVGS